MQAPQLKQNHTAHHVGSPSTGNHVHHLQLSSGDSSSDELALIDNSATNVIEVGSEPEVPTKRRPRQLIFYTLAVAPLVIYFLVGSARFVIPETNASWSMIVLVLLTAILTYQNFLCLLGYYSILRWGEPSDQRPAPDWHWNPDFKLIVAYVSRGNQPGTLYQASCRTQSVLDALGVAYTLELVTDIEVSPEYHLSSLKGEVLYYTVPTEYQTKEGARYKARALQYLLEQRTMRLQGQEDVNNVWIMHLDEESVLSPECVLGIAAHIEKYDLRHTPGAIGQGEILYNSQRYGENLFIAATDALRTGQDLGHFRWFYKMNIPLIGMHGSYVLVPARIEREISWDVGGQGSVTEDAYFALLAMQQGVRFDWVDGFIHEQSPFSLMDIVRQRRRWYSGLCLVAFHPMLKFKSAAFLQLAVLFWGLGALSTFMPYWFLLHQFLFGASLVPYWLYLMGVSSWALFGGQYCIGTYRNLKHCELPSSKKVLIAMSSVVIWFVSVPAIAESLGTLYAIFFPVKTFYVVQKDEDEKAYLPNLVSSAVRNEIPQAAGN